MHLPAQGDVVCAGSRLVLMVVGLWLWLFAGGQNVLFAAQEVPREILSAATNGLPGFLAQIPAQAKALYGFEAGDDLSRCHLGAPLQQHTITPASLKKATANPAVSSVVSDTSMWFFPVMLGAETKAMLVVDHMPDGWKAVSLGYAGLARELNAIRAQWPESKGFHPRLIVVFQAKQYFFSVPEVDDFNLTQIRLGAEAAAAKTAEARYAHLDSFPAAAPSLRATLRAAGVDAGP